MQYSRKHKKQNKTNTQDMFGLPRQDKNKEASLSKISLGEYSPSAACVTHMQTQTRRTACLRAVQPLLVRELTTEAQVFCRNPAALR